MIDDLTGERICVYGGARVPHENPRKIARRDISFRPISLACPSHGLIKRRRSLSISCAIILRVHYDRYLQNVSRATFSHLHLREHSWKCSLALPQQGRRPPPVSPPFLDVRGAAQHRVQVSQLRADEPLSTRDVPSISKSHRALLDRKVGERYDIFFVCVYIYIYMCIRKNSL